MQDLSRSVLNMTVPDESVEQLLDALSTLRMVLPTLLLSILLVRFAVKAFLLMMDRIQSQGWRLEEGDLMFVNALPRVEEEDDAIHPVVVINTSKRRGLILSLFALVAITYFCEGAAQVIESLINDEFTPDLSIFQDMIIYVIGGLSAFALCSIAMNAEERFNKKEGAWGNFYPRLLVALGLCLEIAIVSILARIIQLDSSNQPSSTILPTIDLAFISLRILLLVFLLLSQTPLLYKSKFVPYRESTSRETTSLLGLPNGTTYGAVVDGEDSTTTTVKKPSTLRSSRPPTNRPPDADSLSLLTLFTRIKILFPYLWPSKSLGLQILALVCFGLMLLKRVVNVFTPLFFGRIIGDLSAGRAPYVNIGLYVAASFLQDSNTMLYRYLWLPVSQYSEREMSNLSFECLLNLSLSFHTKRKTGELLRILARSDAINDFFETLIFTFIPILIDLPVAAVILYTLYGPEIVVVVMIVSVIFVATSVTLAESRTKLYRALRDENVFMSQIKTDSLLNWETVKIFTAERFEAERLRTAMRVYQKGYFNVYSSWNSLSLIQDAISAVGLLLCSFILARRVINHEIDIGLYVTFVSYLAQLYGPLNKIAGLYKTVMSNLVDTEQLMDLLNSEKDVEDRAGAKGLIVERDSGIVFDNVKFSYDGKQDTIKGISLEIPFGKSVALVGESGGGKSTIMRLLYRFYDVTSGSISIGGVDIRDLTQISLRQNIGLVPQDSVLFNETVRYNIGYGNHSASEESIQEAAKAASIHDRILSFPEQYETRVGERGQRLSGGEKQRVAIARVILKNAPILLLDEATSALDTQNERQIQQRLREISKGRTTLSIAHRLSTIVDSDVIYVLSEGLIAEFGSHQELLEKEGLYFNLWQKQIQADSEAAGGSTPDLKKIE